MTEAEAPCVEHRTLRVAGLAAPVLVITGDGPRPDVPCDEAREPAFGMKAVWVSASASLTFFTASRAVWSDVKGSKVKVPEPLRRQYPELEAIADTPPTEPMLFPLGRGNDVMK